MVVDSKFDVVVIGGGPAGMMAAGRAAQCGASVLLLEKNDSLGKKLLSTGGGRCNITNTESDTRKFVDKLGKNGRFFYSALSNFSCEDTTAFFKSYGLKLKVEKGNKVFPASDKATDVLNALIEFLKENGVVIKSKSAVRRLVYEGSRVSLVECSKANYYGDQYIIATGGLSYPSTGSSGDGYDWADKSGHRMVETRPALMPIITDEKWVHELQGTPREDVYISVYSGGKKIDGCRGDVMFTHYGLISPDVLNLSEKIGESLKSNDVYVELDLCPDIADNQIDKCLLDVLQKNANKDILSALKSFGSAKLLKGLIALVGIEDVNKKAHSITKAERKKMCGVLKRLKVNISDVFGYEKAIITAGGVSLKDIDPKSMRSKKIENLYFAGEVVDLHGPTGGYNLQVAWSTGYLAGESAGYESLR